MHCGVISSLQGPVTLNMLLSTPDPGFSVCTGSTEVVVDTDVVDVVVVDIDVVHVVVGRGVHVVVGRGVQPVLVGAGPFDGLLPPFPLPPFLPLPPCLALPPKSPVKCRRSSILFVIFSSLPPDMSLIPGVM